MNIYRGGPLHGEPSRVPLQAMETCVRIGGSSVWYRYIRVRDNGTSLHYTGVCTGHPYFDHDSEWCPDHPHQGAT